MKAPAAEITGGTITHIFFFRTSIKLLSIEISLGGFKKALIEIGIRVNNI